MRFLQLHKKISLLNWKKFSLSPYLNRHHITLIEIYFLYLYNFILRSIINSNSNRFSGFFQSLHKDQTKLILSISDPRNTGRIYLHKVIPVVTFLVHNLTALLSIFLTLSWERKIQHELQRHPNLHKIHGFKAKRQK